MQTTVNSRPRDPFLGTSPESAPTLPPLDMCPALVLAGGLGTRLSAIYDGWPKCMAPVGGRYFLEYLLMRLRSAGVRELILCVGYKKERIQSWLGNGSQQGFRVRYSVEKELRGTAGALRLAAKMVKAQSCLVLNGDSFLEVDFREMYRFHRAKRAIATLALACVRSSARYGGVQLDPTGRIAAFFEKGDGVAKPPLDPRGFHLINGGVYLLQRRFFDSIPAEKTTSLEKEIFPALAGGKLYGFVTRGFFIDIGVPKDYARAQTELPKRFSV